MGLGRGCGTASRSRFAEPLLTVNGESPFESWFTDLAAAAKVAVGLARLGQGNTENTKSVGEGLLEYRIDWGPGYRVYFGRDGATLVILLTGGTKQRQQRDIARAKGLWADYERRRQQPVR
jgi:putative addiction module killer protein